MYKSTGIIITTIAISVQTIILNFWIHFFQKYFAYFGVNIPAQKYINVLI
jgi:hypothetical protein